MQPSSVLVTQGSSASVVVSIAGLGGFSGQVSVTVTAMPSGINVTPSQFSLTAGNQQTVTVAANQTAVVGGANLTVSGTSGSLQHSKNISLTVNSQQMAMHPPLRTRYLRTDASWDLGFLNFTPQPLILYESNTKRFFVSNSNANNIDVFDATTMLKIAEIPIPAPWVGDLTPDHTTIYMGTLLGDVYAIDPVTMSVQTRYPDAQIGPEGFNANLVRVMADGRLALLGGLGGIPAVDGYQKVGLWNPQTNALTDVSNDGSQVCPLSGYIIAFTLTADRTKLVMGSGLSGGAVCTYDPSTGAQNFVVTDSLGIGVEAILVPPDGTHILVPVRGTVKVYDVKDLFESSRFDVGNVTDIYRCLLSIDGNTMFAFPRLSSNPGLAYDLKTRQQKGWITNFGVHHLASAITPMAVDETGLVAGVIGEGIAFVDTSVLWPAVPGPSVSFSYSDTVSPSAGPSAGGMQVQINALQSIPVDKLYFGNQLATGLSPNSLGLAATTPAGAPGPVDVTVTTANGGLTLLPEAFSYGPSIVEIITNSSTAEGGGKGLIYGYGFGEATYNGQAPGLQLSIGGQSVPVTKYSPQPYRLVTFSYPFPMESFEFTIPPGVAGKNEDIVVSNSAGSVTAPAALQYLPAITTYPLSNAILVQGIYDPRRDLYYFTDQTQVQVFSRTQGAWLSPISIPNATFLWGIAISPDGNRVAVADAGANVIHVYDPGLPAAVSRFSLPDTGINQGGAPCAVAITDAGIVYYVSFYVGFTGGWALHKLDVTTANVTDYQSIQAGGLGNDAYSRISLTNDNARLFANIGGMVYMLDTATDAVYFNPLVLQGDYELTVSSNQTWMSATEYLMDTNMNPISYLVYNGREVWEQSWVYGEKLSPSGNLLFVPMMNGIDVVDGKFGVLRTRITLPVSLSPNYDALVVDGRENVLVAITGANGDGIAVINLKSLPEPPPLPSAAAVKNGLLVALKNGQQLQPMRNQVDTATKSELIVSPSKLPQLRRITNDLAKRLAKP